MYVFISSSDNTLLENTKFIISTEGRVLKNDITGEIENLKNIVIGSIPLRAEPDLRKTSSDIDSVLLFQVFKEINQ